MSEYATKKARGAFIAAIFAMQGIGNLTASVVTIIISTAFRKAPAYQHDPVGQADYVWRIILMFGALPAILTYYLRKKMPETARYTALITKNAKQAASDMATVLNLDINPEDQREEEVEEECALTRLDDFGLFSMEFVYRHGLHLLGTTICWLVLDVSYYTLNLFMKDFFTEVGWFGDTKSMSPLEQTYKIACTQVYMAIGGTIGYFFTVGFIDHFGRIRIQLLGFTMMTVFMLGLAIPYHYWHITHKHIAFFFLYTCTIFFANFGANSTTFIIPVEIFPARLRSTCHGVSGAGGKAGAILGVFWFLYCKKNTSKILFILVGFNIIGLVFTLVLPEPKQKSLEELTGEIEEEEPPEDANTVMEYDKVYSV